MNAWPGDLGEAPVRGPRRRDFRAVGLASGTVVIFAALAVAAASASSPEGLATLATAAVSAPAVTLAAAPVAAPAKHAEPEPQTIRIQGTVGPDLTAALKAAGVPEAQGRAYVAALATAIDLRSGLSVADRFDLVMLREDGRPGELAYAGLDRVGRGDLQLMKWTDGKEVRWVDADGIDPTAKGMKMPVAGRVSSPFGERFHPVLGSRRMHSGVDVAARYGAPIVAAADGRVVSAGWSGGYGRQVAIEHSGGVRTSYSHMSSIAAAPGVPVRQGQVIGYVGSSGLSTGPHLHYEVFKDGRKVNPLTVELARSPLKDEELHAFRSRLRGLLTAASAG